MAMDGGSQEARGSAVRWFAYASIAITLTAAVGAHGLAWLARAKREPILAILTPERPGAAKLPGAGVDMTTTGSVSVAARPR